MLKLFCRVNKVNNLRDVIIAYEKKWKSGEIIKIKTQKFSTGYEEFLVMEKLKYEYSDCDLEHTMWKNFCKPMLTA